MTSLLRALILCSIIVLAGCGETIQTPTGPTTVEQNTLQFTGSLAVGGSRFYSFRVTQGGWITATLASVTSASGAAVPTALGLGVGTPQGTGCALLSQVTTAARLTTQLSSILSPGIHCIQVADVGNLTADVGFSVRFTFP